MTAPSAATTSATWVADAFDVRWDMGTVDHGRWAGPVQLKRTATKRSAFNAVVLIRHRDERF